MMKLRYSTASPFARKVVIVAREAGVNDRVSLETTNAWAPDTDLPNDNPLGKVPALVTDGGEALYDSPVICEYLDSLNQGAKLFPAEGAARWTALRRQALADGVMDAAVTARIESVSRPEEFRWPAWVARQKAAIARALDVLETEADAMAGLFTIGEITVVCALGYLDFRFPEDDWRASRPRLAAWHAEAAQRPSVVATVPVG